MKLWRLVLAMYVVVLSGLPCEAFCPDDTYATQQAPLPASGNQAHDESCSPFCLCATCPGFTVPYPPQLVVEDFLPDLPVVVILRPNYQAPHAFEVLGRIWQPPRLS